jgi:hypothetical protein
MNNILEKLKIPEGMRLTKHRTSYNEALDHIQAEYDKLCPRVEEFRNGCKFATIDPDGEIIFHINKPTIVSGWYSEPYPEYEPPHNVDFPLGLDWRLCRWSLDDAKRIWGEE